MKIKFSLPLTILILLLVYGVFWQPGPRVANDSSIISLANLKAQMNLPQTWSIKDTEGLGEYAVFTLWSYPFSFLTGVLANLGLSFAVIERVLIIIPLLLLGILSMNKFARLLKLSEPAKFITTIFYLTNTYILLLIDGGQLTIGLAYALFPLVFLSIIKAIESGRKKRILAALLVAALGVFDPRFIYILVILCLIYFLYWFKGKEWIKNWIKTVIVILPIYLGLNFYWILVFLKSPLSGNTFAALTQSNFVSLISLGNSLLLLSPHWYKNVFGDITVLHFEFFVIPILAFLAPILRSKNRMVGFWLLIALLAVFLTKGSAEPLSSVYPWAYSHLPGFTLFRDSSKFFFLVALAYSALIGITIDEVMRKFPKLKTVFTLTLAVFLTVLIRPVWLGQMTGTFSKPPLEKDYQTLDNLILSNPDTGKVFWIPTIAPLTGLNSNHPAVEASRLVTKRPFAQGVVGTYEEFNFLREAPYMGQLFDVANIGYIVDPPPDLRRETDQDKIKYYYTFLNQLSNLPWLARVNNSPVPLLKVKKYQDRIFTTPNVWWIIGADDIYSQSTKSANLALSQNALIFADETAGLGQKIDRLPEAKIVLNHKTAVDLAAGFLSASNLIFPASQLKHDPDTSGWWKRETADFTYWRDFLKTKYGILNQDFDLGGGWAVAETSLKLKVKSSKLQSGQTLLARVLESSRSGSLNFYQKDKLIGQINTAEVGDNVRWFVVGNLDSTSELTIKNAGDINVINALAILPKNIWLQDQKKAQDLLQEKRVETFNEVNIASEEAKISYKYDSPTHLSISIVGLTHPQMLIFSQNFDKNWLLNGKEPLPVYSLLNGYLISHNGQYDLIFQPQQYITAGIIVSVITLVLSLILLLV